MTRKQTLVWTQYLAEGDDYIPVERWGRDHWSTLAYLETLVVDNKGVIDNRKMRCNARLHRPFVGLMFGGAIQDGSKYPTILKDGELPGHDDWSCLEDMVAVGFVISEWHVKDRKLAFGGCEGRVTFTEAGLRIAAELRAFKAGGGNFSQFTPAALQVPA